MTDLSEWLQYLFEITVGVVAVVWLFEGARRLATHGVRKDAPLTLLMLAGGVAISLAAAGVAYAQHRFSLELLEFMKRPIFSKYVPLPDGWGADCCKGQMEPASRQLVQAAFVESGQVHTYFDSTGRRTQFTPAQSDIGERDRRILSHARLADASRAQRSGAISSLVAGLMAVLLGAALGYEQRRRSAGKTAQGAPGS